MNTVRFVHWRDGAWWYGYLQDFPDYWTQGESFDDLREHLRDLHRTLSDPTLEGVRQVGELSLS